jgi:ABC-type siderophore export system fused ATPase/permease subunit
VSIFLHVLAAMFALGCFGGTLWLARSVADEESRLGAALALLVGIPLAVFIGALPFVLIAQGASPNLVTLKKNEWACTSAHTQVVTSYTMSNRTMIPIVTSHKVCDAYGRTR